MRFALSTQVTFNRNDAALGTQMLAWLAQEVSPSRAPQGYAETLFLAGTTEDACQLDIVTQHDNAFEARAFRYRIGQLIKGSRWATTPRSVDFAIRASYAQAEAADGVPPDKTWPHP